MKFAHCSPIITLITKVLLVNGHGYAWFPYSRNALAYLEGKGSYQNSDDTVVKFYGAPGLENGGETFGACGRRWNNDPRGFTDREDILTPNGNVFPFTAQAHYIEGDVIEIRSVITAHHRGHINMYACTNVNDPTEACFKANPLEYIDDLLYGAPKHPDYPSRAYLAPESEKGNVDPEYEGDLSHPHSNGMLFVHRFKLPEGIYGDEVLLQWFWVTNQGCRSPGDYDYPFPNDSWKPTGSMSNVCDYLLNGYAECSRDDPDLYDCRDPQIFRNCIEVSIEAFGTAEPTKSIMPSSKPSLRPSSKPSTSQVPSTPPEPSTKPSFRPSSKPSVSQSPSFSAEGCCSVDLKACHDQPTDQCNTFENCESSCNRYWLPTGAREGCHPLNHVGCDVDTNDCCEGATCVEEGANGACRAVN